MGSSLPAGSARRGRTGFVSAFLGESQLTTKGFDRCEDMANLCSINCVPSELCWGRGVFLEM